MNPRGRIRPFSGIAALGIALAALVPACAGAETWTLDAARSHAGFAVKHLVFAPITFETALDPKGIDTGNGDRDGSLRGRDYFDVPTYPTWTFASSSVEPGNR